MLPLQPQQLQQVEMPLVPIDPHLRIRITAELREIGDALQESNLRDRDVGRIGDLINLWYGEFHRLARPPNRNEVMPRLDEVIARFSRELENLLASPVDLEHPYPPQLFGEELPSIVRFLVAKATDRHSLLFSEKIHAAKPAPPALLVIPEDLEEQLRMIHALRAQREQEAEDAMPEFQNLVRDLRDVEQRQAEQLARINGQLRQALIPLAQGIRELGVDVPRQREVLIAAIERQERRLEVLQGEFRVLEADLRDVRQGIEAQRVADINLQISTNRLDQSIEQKKKEQNNDLLLAGGLMIASGLITWGLSSYYYGVSVSLMQCTKTFISVGVTLGAAGATQSDKGPPQPQRRTPQPEDWTKL